MRGSSSPAAHVQYPPVALSLLWSCLRHSCLFGEEDELNVELFPQTAREQESVGSGKVWPDLELDETWFHHLPATCL